ncbi:helix-turn-helix domain-containing protein [Paenibacillaceae bacterium]|nr:helix-turn-helix domain-containing protein [Paenibacillaceae bacterium]
MVLELGEELRSYRLPASSFLYAVRGNAQVWLDGVPHVVDRFHVIHGGKGMCLDIKVIEPFEYYIVLYKAKLSHPSKREQLRLEDRGSPFHIQYSFAPHHPIPLLLKIEQMYKEWSGPDLLQQVHIKSLFFQFVYEHLWQLSNHDIDMKHADPVAQTIRYLEDNYAERVTMDELAGMLDCSTGYLTRLFKRATGTSPIDYLIAIRLEKAKALLLTTEATLQEIAECVGFSDDSYFNRLFKKHIGVSMGQYRLQGQHCPVNRSEYTIVPRNLKRYIVNGYENHYHTQGEGYHMKGPIKTPLAVTLLLCLTLLLAACSAGTGSTNTANNSSSNSTASANNTSQGAAAGNETAANEAGAARTIKHAMGEEQLTGTPERVVILTNEGTEALLAVGMKPVGAVMSWIGEPWYDHIKDEMVEVTVVGDELQPNLELIASLKPDLIIGNKVRQEKIYEQLKQIAPTVFAEDLSGFWKENFRLYTETINKKTEGEDVLAAFDKRVAEVKEKLGEKANTKVSIVRFSASQVRIYQKNTFSGVLLDQLGIARPASQDVDGFIEVLSKEQISEMDGDVMFYFVSENVGSTDAANVVEEWMNDPLFKNLDVAKNNKVIQVDEGIWNSAGGYKAANLLLDELAKYFEVQ